MDQEQHKLTKLILLLRYFRIISRVGLGDVGAVKQHFYDSSISGFTQILLLIQIF